MFLPSYHHQIPQDDRYIYTLGRSLHPPSLTSHSALYHVSHIRRGCRIIDRSHLLHAFYLPSPPLPPAVVLRRVYIHLSVSSLPFVSDLSLSPSPWTDHAVCLTRIYIHIHTYQLIVSSSSKHGSITSPGKCFDTLIWKAR